MNSRMMVTVLALLSAVGLVTLFTLGEGQAAPAEKPPDRVEVINFPDPQHVAGTVSQ